MDSSSYSRSDPEDLLDRINKSLRCDASSDDDTVAPEVDLLSIITSVRSGVILSDRVGATIVPSLPNLPSPIPLHYWTEPCATSFRVRGPNYSRDRKKQPSGEALFRLFAVDLVQVSKPILSGMCNHPHERVQRCLQAEKNGDPSAVLPPFIFCVNITLPGKPAHHLVMYYAIDDASLLFTESNHDESNHDESDDDPVIRAFRKLALPFFFGNSDEYRDSTFKLIPRIVTGNFVVKKAVGSKPTILGKKVKQHYIRDQGVHEKTGKPRFFELIVDVGSDSIAKRVVGLSCGYAKSLVVDMAFVLEGKSRATLPESVMATVRLLNIDFKANLRRVEQPP